MDTQLKSWASGSQLQHRTSRAVENAGPSDFEIDRSELARVGKKQVLRRNFDLASMIGFSSVLVSLWENILLSFQLGLVNGGPAGLIYGYIFAWAGMTCVYITLGELASMIPTSGGQYHWVSIFAPEKSKTFLSYVCGWLTVLGWAGAIASTSFFSGSMIQALIVHNNPSYTPTGWQETLIMWAVLVLVLFFNTALSRTLPAIEVCILMIHIFGFFAIFITILYLAPKASAESVFTTFKNQGGWPTQGLSFFVGLSGNAAAFVGADGSVHMSEEVRRATVNVPRSMIFSTLFNGLLAWAMLIAFLFCAGTITEAESESPYPYIPILARITGSDVGATILASLIVVLEFCACIAATATASRMMWAFARDHGLPNWRQLSQVDVRTSIPLKCLLVGVLFAALFGLINIGSTTAFNDIISLVLVSLYGTYILACGLLLYRRLNGDIGDDTSSDKKHLFTWGPWRIKGLLGILINTVAVLYLVLMAFFSFWPSEAKVTAANMNYSSLLFGAAVIWSMIYYVFWAHKTYKGPVVEVGPFA
ncbi:MAG: hypothetical protein MMC23_000859 [Stictis urceolatum]|nr:hypothetical protein [Stictis urceolata]